MGNWIEFKLGATKKDFEKAVEALYAVRERSVQTFVNFTGLRLASKVWLQLNSQGTPIYYRNGKRNQDTYLYQVRVLFVRFVGNMLEIETETKSVTSKTPTSRFFVKLDSVDSVYLED